MSLRKIAMFVLAIASAVISQAAAAYAPTAEVVGYGSGPFKAEMRADKSLPTHTIYRPQNLQVVGKLPILVWGNGSCANFGNRYRYFLTELASHGYLVVAIGPIGPSSYESAESIPNGRPAGLPPPDGMKRATRYTQLTDAINWALAQNKRRDSEYYKRLDAKQIAVMGTSCGGLQAILASADLRVKTSVIFNSGTFPDGSPPTDGANATRASIGNIHAPVAFITGDESDIAFVNADADYALVTKIPALRAFAKGVGHRGTYRQPNGGIFAPVAIAWLDWQLKRSAQAERWFAGPNCRLCSDPAWVVRTKNFD